MLALIIIIIIIFICHDIQHKPDTECIINNENSMTKGLDTIWYMCPHTNNLIYIITINVRAKQV